MAAARAVLQAGPIVGQLLPAGLVVDRYYFL
jgi:hypothetical protein